MNRSQNIAVFPGSFDPFTKGHEEIVRRALPLFDKLYIAIGYNINKQRQFSIEEQKNLIASYFSQEENIEIVSYEGLTTDFCHHIGARYIVRGLRNFIDFHYESEMAAVNKTLAPDIETIFLPTNPAFAHISSSTVREIIKNGGDSSIFIPNVPCEK